MKYLESYDVIAYVIAVITVMWRILPEPRPTLGICITGYIFTFSVILSLNGRRMLLSLSWMLLIVSICEILGGIDFESLRDELGGGEDDDYQRRDSDD